MNKQAFTLVELIVSIVILAILGTIGFISLSGYAVSARDSTRASDMRAIEKQLSIHIVKFDKYPEPDDKVNIIAGGNVVSYQGYAGKDVLDTLKVFNGGKDPVDDEYYVYSTNVSRTQYQLLGYFENGLSAYSPGIVSQAQAEYGDLTSRVPQVKGDPIGILLDTTTKQPIQDSVAVGVPSVNITTSTTTYDMVANNEDEPISASGAALVAIMPIVTNNTSTQIITIDYSSCKSILDTGGSTGDGTYTINPTGNNAFDVYCDMDALGDNMLTVDWTVGNSSIGGFIKNGSHEENNRVTGIGPWGDQTILWESVNNDGYNDLTSADGGWNYSSIPIDESKTYRLSVYIKKTNSDAGRTYFGTLSATRLSGSVQNNPYFWNGDLPELDKWYLLVGYVHPSDYSSSTSFAGIYDVETGQKVISGVDYKHNLGATHSRHRAYLYYDTDLNDKQYFYGPRFEEINPAELGSIGNLAPIVPE